MPNRRNYQSIKSIINDEVMDDDEFRAGMAAITHNRKFRNGFQAYLRDVWQAIGLPKEKIKNALITMDEIIQAMSTTINGTAPEVGALKIGQGFPQALPKITMPILYVGYGPLLLSTAKSVADMLHIKKGEKYREDYAIVTEGLNAATFSLRTVIALYVWLVSDFGKSHKEVDASDDMFAGLVAASSVFPLLYIVLATLNVHHRFTNKFVIGILYGFGSLTKAVITKDTIDNLAYAKESSNYSIQLAGYMASIVSGILLTAASIKHPKRAAKILNTLSAINLTYIFLELWEGLKKDETLDDTQKYLFLMMYTSTLIIPFATMFVYKCLYKDLRHQYEAGPESAPLLPEDLERGDLDKELHQFVGLERADDDKDYYKHLLILIRNESSSDEEQPFVSSESESASELASESESASESASEEDEHEQQMPSELEERQKDMLTKIEELLARVVTLEEQQRASELAQQQEDIIKKTKELSKRMDTLESKEEKTPAERFGIFPKKK